MERFKRNSKRSTVVDLYELADLIPRANSGLWWVYEADIETAVRQLRLAITNSLGLQEKEAVDENHECEVSIAG